MSETTSRYLTRGTWATCHRCDTCYLRSYFREVRPNDLERLRFFVDQQSTDEVPRGFTSEQNRSTWVRSTCDGRIDGFIVADVCASEIDAVFVYSIRRRPCTQAEVEQFFSNVGLGVKTTTAWHFIISTQ